jgi:hypothetical protein
MVLEQLGIHSRAGYRPSDGLHRNPAFKAMMATALQGVLSSHCEGGPSVQSEPTDDSPPFRVGFPAARGPTFASPGRPRFRSPSRGRGRSFRFRGRLWMHICRKCTRPPSLGGLRHLSQRGRSRHTVAAGIRLVSCCCNVIR